jgi:hypothetical protein
MEKVLRFLNFGNEAGDDVGPEELASYFVEQAAFNKFLNHTSKLLVATARKGVGKSALLQWIAQRTVERHPEAIVIKVRGADLVRSKFHLTSELITPNDHINDWMVRLCTLVNRQLAAQIGFAVNDDEITLIETAELEGYKRRNIVGCLLDRFQSLLEKGRGVTKLTAKNEIEILKRVKDRDVWIIIDDLDATYQNTEREQLSLATCFSACRYLTQDLRGMHFRITIRTDVWPLLRRYDESLDKMEQYVSEIIWYEKDFLKLLALRVKASFEAASIALPSAPAYVSREDVDERLLQTAFSETMEWAQKLQPTYRVIYTLSYERPRWAIQLCKLAQQAALRRNASVISKDIIDEVWGEYGMRRIADLVSEHKHQCPQVEELLNAFRGAARLMSREDLFGWINSRVSSHIDIHIEGQKTRSPREVARFLYRLGFILARSEGPEGYEHYRFDQMPDFLSARTDEDFAVKWEIHPCYREALDIKKLDKSHREKFSRLRQRNGPPDREFDPRF